MNFRAVPSNNHNILSYIKLVIFRLITIAMITLKISQYEYSTIYNNSKSKILKYENYVKNFYNQIKWKTKALQQYKVQNHAIATALCMKD